MLRKLLATTLLLVTACAPIPTPPTQPPATASAVATVIPPTQEPPLYYLHPKAQGVASINVMQAYCHSRYTTIAVYEYAVEWHYDFEGETDCVSRGILQ